MKLSVAGRAHTIERMCEEEYDIAIIGGGITGAGIARDAASRGLRVALIEGSDFASGTSSRSSKLIHGGIRYLENLEFHLVFEALSERQRLFELAPHLVHPLKFLLPVYKGGRVPAWKMGLGMWLYDALSLFEAPELSKFLTVDEVSREFPALQLKDLSGAFTYYDAYMDDDRLVLETLRSAREHGADIVNYVRATGADFEGEFLGAVECEDQITKQKFPLRAHHFVSSVGPWTDRLGKVLLPDWKRQLRPSKGVHLTFNKHRFKLHDAVVMAAESRIVFAIPRHEMVIVGTTDTDFPEDPAQVSTSKEDVEYLLRVIHQYFPGANITHDDIIGCYAGVRPLIDDGSQTESKTSREHLIWTDPCGVTFVAGGKYTTYRNMAEQTVNEVLDWFSTEDRVRYSKSQTLQPLNPLVTDTLFERARNEHKSWAKDWQIAPQVTAALAERHGIEALNLIRQALPVRIKCRDDEEWMWCAEALHAIENSMCLSLTDFYFRRTPLVLSREDHGLTFAKAVAQVMGERLGWDQNRRHEEINALQKQIDRELAGINLG